ncbi:organic hydroperoxide resistance protein [Luteimicrobium subarcticum]|uniref:Ohr subfamily peroxiredoxin n=1 Tax=Luteimicrobium subarcticum TaxID=620910 RepID=A0A2M8WVK8_9MICO|nr:organic hydroperoxide resistance protein [Luteimicrobium subarcticum]PJI94961.1 Ohr subfamily peroxiredoxin [Luteimicrobium subarcticum]
MDILYTASALSTGEGRSGHVRTSDGSLDTDLFPPQEMGGPGGGLNPEMLFAAGYAACFHSAMLGISKQRGVTLADESVTAEVGIGRNESGVGFGLAVTLRVELPGLSQQDADALVAAAHEVCPYSNATRGNVDVTLDVTVG